MYNFVVYKKEFGLSCIIIIIFNFVIIYFLIIFLIILKWYVCFKIGYFVHSKSRKYNARVNIIHSQFFLFFSLGNTSR